MTQTSVAHSSDYRQRSRARRRAVQAIYQWQITGNDMVGIRQAMLDDCDLGAFDTDYFWELLQRIPVMAAELDTLIDPWLDRPLRTIDPVEQAILRLGAFELMERIEVPYRVVLDEAVELAKVFGAEQSHRYINGVLDRVGRGLTRRAAELEPSQPRG
jgi:N utilization substance protein B